MSKCLDANPTIPIVNGRDREETAIVLMSTLATAADVVYGMSERRQGRDPSSQEDSELAGRWIRAAAHEIEEYLLSLRAGRILLERDDAEGSHAHSRRMSEVMILNHLVRLFQVVHQRLLSLYPAVSEELVEDSRLLHAECTALRDGEADSIGPFVARVQRFCDDLFAALGA